MEADGLRLVGGLFAASVVSAIGYLRRALSPDGAVAATAVGGLVFAAGGIVWAAPLLFFFVTGSALTHLRRHEKARRSARQVLANGGVAALASLLRLAWGPGVVWDALVVGSLAAMAADTWATEVGLLARWPAREILTGKPVAPGVSGGMSVPGTLAGVAGALITAWLPGAVAGGSVGLAAHGSPFSLAGWGAGVWPAAGVAGVVGMVADSLLGAFAQARYRCDRCGLTTEHAGRHRRDCPGARLVRVHGWSWLDNDGVNFLAACLGGLVAVAAAGQRAGPAPL